MPWKWYTGKIADIENYSNSVKKFLIEIDDIEEFNFQAGQFITMDLPIAEKRVKRWRSYSIANAPNGSNRIELCIVHLKGGLGTNYLFNEAKIGTEVKFKGPSGAFYLPEHLTKDVVMICTGTGVAPFRSMIVDLVRKKSLHRNFHLIYGSRTEDDILYREEFENLASEYPNFTYDISLSRDKHWEGYRGYVHQVYMSKYSIEEAQKMRFYICGWSQMIDEAVENLLIHKKVDRKDIIYELYG